MKKIDITDELVKRLIKIYDNDDFIKGVLTFVQSDEMRMKMIEYIDEPEPLNESDVVLYAEELAWKAGLIK